MYLRMWLLNQLDCILFYSVYGSILLYFVFILKFFLCNFRYNLGDYSGEIMFEVMVQRQLVKFIYVIFIISIINSSQFKYQDVTDLKEFKVNKVIRVL